MIHPFRDRVLQVISDCLTLLIVLCGLVLIGGLIFLPLSVLHKYGIIPTFIGVIWAACVTIFLVVGCIARAEDQIDG